MQSWLCDLGIARIATKPGEWDEEKKDGKEKGGRKKTKKIGRMLKMHYTMSWHFHIIALQYIVPITPYYNIMISACFHIVILLIGKQEAYHICLLSRIQSLRMMSAHKDLL